MFNFLMMANTLPPVVKTDKSDYGKIPYKINAGSSPATVAQSKIFIFPIIQNSCCHLPPIKLWNYGEFLISLRKSLNIEKDHCQNPQIIKILPRIKRPVKKIKLKIKLKKIIINPNSNFLFLATKIGSLPVNFLLIIEL